MVIRIQLLAQEINFEYITSDQGLSHSSVTSIVQDVDGFMWFGTLNGLNRYDGYEFVKYYQNPRDSSSLIGDRIEDLFIDSHGDLWIGSNNGLSRYDKDLGTFINYFDDFQGTPGLYKGRNACGMFEDSKGRLWIGSFGGGVNVYQRETDSFINYAHDPEDSSSLSGNIVRGIAEDQDGTMWFGTENNGLNEFREDSKTFIRYQHDESNPKSLPYNAIYALANDENGTIWAGTLGKGLVQIQKNGRGDVEFINHVPETNDLRRLIILTLKPAKSGGIWIGTENGGLDFFDVKAQTFKNYRFNELEPSSLNNNSIHAIYEDPSDNLWIGTYTGGVNVHKANRKAIKTYRRIPGNENSLSYNAVSSFYEDDKGDIWIGTDGGGLNVWNRKDEKFTRYDSENTSLMSDAILAICPDSNNYLWIGGWGAAFNKYLDHGQFYTISQDDGIPNNNIFDMVLDHKGNLWATFGGIGFGKYKPSSNTFELYTPANSDLPSPWVQDLNVDPEGNILLAHTSGFSIFSPDNKSMTNYVNSEEDSNTLSQNQVNTVLVSHDSSIWIGTVNGLNHFFPKEQRFIRYFEHDGLPNNNIAGLLEDQNGDLWISTANGISRLDHDRVTFKNYQFSDGLQGKSFIRNSAYALASGELLFGGTNGFNIFHPDSLRDNLFDPPIIITGFSVFNTPVSLHDVDSPLKKDITQADEITLAYDQSVFSFEFASLDYTAPEQNEYAYMLEEFDQAWNYVGNKRFATYTSIDPGDYTFKVKATNNDGLWSTKMATIKVSIQPPWWQELWFRISLFLFITGLLLTVHRIRVRVLQQQKKLLEDTVKKRTVDIMEMNNEIEAQNEELRAQSEEMSTQNEQLELLNNNIIEQKNKISEINKSLEVKVVERTEQLNHSIEELNKTISELDRFVYSASHDLSAPLKSIKGLIGLTKYDEVGEGVKEKLEYIERSIDQLEEVIKSLTEFSRNSRMELKIKEFSLKELIDDCFQELKFLQQGMDVALELNIDNSLMIKSDKMRLRMIINNLFSNAIKYQDPEKTEHFLKVMINEGKDTWTMIFEDNGIGIESEYLERVFYMFYRATEKSKGSGLGLYIVKETVKKLGGEISVNSNIKEGSVFTICVPKID